MLRLQTKAQIAFEFVMLVSVAFMALLVFTAFVRDNYSEIKEDVEYFQLKDVALSVKTELHVAISLSDGYQRSFFIPFTLDGTEYNISKENGYLLFTSSTSEYYIVVPPFNGTFVKGNNVLTKDDGLLEVNL